MRKYFFLLLPLFFTLYSCEPDNNKSPAAPQANRYADLHLQKIHDFQDERLHDSLASYLRDSNAVYRREAALACASIQELSMLPFLTDLLSDTEPEVAAAAAYAIGQSRDSLAPPTLRLHLAQPDQLWPRDGGHLYSSLMEALGKTGRAMDLDYVLFQHAELSVPHNDRALFKCLYRFSLNKITSQKAQQTALEGIFSSDSQSALWASASLSRLKDLDEGLIQTLLLPRLDEIKNAEVRMNCMRILGQLPADQSRSPLLAVANNSQEDYRTRVFAAYAYRLSDSGDIFQDLRPLILDDNPHVAVAASEILNWQGKNLSPDSLVALAKACTNWRPAGNVLRAAVKAADSVGEPRLLAQVTDPIRQRFEQSQNPYEKSSLMMALSESEDQLDYLLKVMEKNESPLLLASSMEAVAALFRKFESVGIERRLGILKQAFETGDEAVLAHASSELTSDAAAYLKEAENLAFIDEAMGKLELPRDIETYNMLGAAKDKMEGKKRRFQKHPDFNHPIDWSVAQMIQEKATATFQTNRGSFVLELYVNECPGTVVNFVELVKANYYDGKVFHRVVPGFVAQSGCSRGDGWGGIETTIRSEFPDLGYETGTIGMASAGKDTEGSQLFIAHNPTPHLDGRYTIFGKVSSGMEVVHQLLVGDVIEGISLGGTP